MTERRTVPQAFRDAQAASWAGRHAEAAALFDEAAATDATIRYLSLQRAMAAARASGPAAGVAILDAAPEAEQSEPAQRLFRAWLAHRAGDPTAADALAECCRRQPRNRVAATMLAGAQAAAGDLGAAVATIGSLPGDNLEVCAWCWAQLERAGLAQPPPTEAPLPPLREVRPSRAAARRWMRAGIAAACEHENVLARRWLLQRTAGPVHRLLAAADRVWPTDALEAFRLAAAAGLQSPLLDEYLGAELYGAGRPEQALVPLRAACDASRVEGDDPLTEEACRPRLYLAAALCDLRRWDDAGVALSELAGGLENEAERVHEFGTPIWFALRGRLRAARGDGDGAAGDFLVALEGEPMLFDERLKQWRETAERLE